MRIPRLILLAGVGLLLAAGAPGAAEPEAGLPAITVSAVARQQLVDRVRASGLIEPVERVLVQPQIDGQAVEAILVEVGDRVAQGDVLVRLSDAALALQRSQLEASRASADAGIAQAEAQLVEAEALREQALRDRDRALRLSEQGAGSQAAADDAASAAATAAARVSVAVQGLNAASAQLNVVDAQIADVELQLRRTSVVAPVGGEVVERGARIGAIASMAGDPLLTLIRDGALELWADVAEQDLLALRPGMAARITVAGLAAPIAGKVRLVEPTVDTATRLGRVRIAIDEPERVRAGMFAEAEILVSARETLAAPVSAVRREAGRSSVLRVTDGRVTEARVETGVRDGAMVEVLDGLAEGDLVVTKAAAFVRDGDRINPVAAAAADPVSN